MTRRSFLVIWHIRFKHRWQRQIIEIAAASAAFLFFGLTLSLAGYFSNILVLDTPLLQTIFETTFPGIKEMEITIGREEEPQLSLLASLLFAFTEGGNLSAKSIVAESLPAFGMVSFIETPPVNTIVPTQVVTTEPKVEAAWETSRPLVIEENDVAEKSTVQSQSSQNLRDSIDQIRRREVEVILYNTHSSEAYHGMIGEAHKKEELDYAFGRWREDAGVIGVTAELEKHLLQAGVNVHRIKKIHDGQIFRLAYVYSEESVKDALLSFGSTKLVLDIHRDGAPDANPFRIPINGQYAAQVSLVVATGERSSRQWDPNLNRDLARRLINMINSRYPGLCRGAIFKTGAYNQHLHPGSLLLEIGNDCNTDAEAQYTARLIAPIIGDLLLEVR